MGDADNEGGGTKARGGGCTDNTTAKTSFVSLKAQHPLQKQHQKQQSGGAGAGGGACTGCCVEGCGKSYELSSGHSAHEKVVLFQKSECCESFLVFVRVCVCACEI